MARLVERSEIVDYATYEDTRAITREKVFAAKELRRVHLNKYLTFLFENRETLRYQIQEIIRTERIVREADILNEIETYNSILGDPGDLGCVLLIGIENEADRKPLLTQWLGLQDYLYVVLDNGDKVYASFDPAQVGDDRISAVQYLRFAVAGRTPVSVGTDFADLACEVALTSDQQAALALDLSV